MDNEDSNIVKITATINKSEETLVTLSKAAIKPNKLYYNLKTAGATVELKVAKKICETICSDTDNPNPVIITVSAKVDTKTAVEKNIEVKRTLENDLSKELGSLKKRIITELPFYIIQCDAFRAI